MAQYTRLTLEATDGDTSEHVEPLEQCLPSPWLVAQAHRGVGAGRL